MLEKLAVDYVRAFSRCIHASDELKNAEKALAASQELLRPAYAVRVDGQLWSIKFQTSYGIRHPTAERMEEL